MKSAMFFVLIFLISQQLSAQKQNVEIIERKCKSLTGHECSKKVFSCDTNIFLTYYGNHTKTASEENLNSLRTHLSIYGHTLPLDKIYFKHIPNKSVKYMCGLYQGDYTKSQGKIFLRLEFINSGINSSRSSMHEYNITYNVHKSKIESIKFSFLDK